MRTLSLRSSSSGLGVILIWAGRLTALSLLLVWGAFFVEHLSEWFLSPADGLPPPWVWVAQLFHLGILAGLALMLKWEKLGSLVTIAATAGFVLVVGDTDILRLVSVNLVPVLCFATARIATSHGPRLVE